MEAETNQEALAVLCCRFLSRCWDGDPRGGGGKDKDGTVTGTPTGTHTHGTSLPSAINSQH